MFNVLMAALHLNTALIFFAVGFILKKGFISKNKFFGVRMKESMSSDENWKNWNEAFGKSLIHASAAYLCTSILSVIVYFEKIIFFDERIEKVIVTCFPHFILFLILFATWRKLKKEK